MRSSAVRSDSRETILDAADRLLASVGYQKMTMEDIAIEAGISKRTIYLRFPSKEEIGLSSIDRVVQNLIKRLELIASSELSSADKIREILITRVMYRFDSVQTYYQSLDEMFAALRPAYLARRQLYFEQEARVIATLVERGKVDGDFTWRDALTTAHILLLATNSLLPSNLNKRELIARSDVEERVESIADILLTGLLVRK